MNLETQRFSAEVTAAINGDGQAFEWLYYQSVNLLRAECRLYLNNEADIEDALQEAYIKIYRKLGDLQDGKVFPAWAKTIARNTCINIIRTKERHAGLEDLNGDYGVEELNSDAMSVVDQYRALDPETVAISGDVSRIVQEVLDELPPIQKTCLLLWNDGCTHGQISERLGIPEGTSKSNVNYAKKKVRSNMERLEKESGVRLHSKASVTTLLALLYTYYNEAVQEVSATADNAQLFEKISSKGQFLAPKAAEAISSAETVQTVETVAAPGGLQAAEAAGAAGAAAAGTSATAGIAATAAGAAAVGGAITGKIVALVIAGVVAVGSIAGIGVAVSKNRSEKNVTTVAASQELTAEQLPSKEDGTKAASGTEDSTAERSTEATTTKAVESTPETTLETTAAATETTPESTAEAPASASGQPRSLFIDLKSEEKIKVMDPQDDTGLQEILSAEFARAEEKALSMGEDGINRVEIKRSDDQIVSLVFWHNWKLIDVSNINMQTGETNHGEPSVTMDLIRKEWERLSGWGEEWFRFTIDLGVGYELHHLMKTGSKDFSWKEAYGENGVIIYLDNKEQLTIPYEMVGREELIKTQYIGKIDSYVSSEYYFDEAFPDDEEGFGDEDLSWFFRIDDDEFLKGRTPNRIIMVTAGKEKETADAPYSSNNFPRYYVQADEGSYVILTYGEEGDRPIYQGSYIIDLSSGKLVESSVVPLDTYSMSPECFLGLDTNTKEQALYHIVLGGSIEKLSDLPAEMEKE